MRKLLAHVDLRNFTADELYSLRSTLRLEIDSCNEEISLNKSQLNFVSHDVVNMDINQEKNEYTSRFK